MPMDRKIDTSIIKRKKKKLITIVVISFISFILIFLSLIFINRFDAYYSEKVTFTNPVDHLSLAGTLTLPAKKGVFPVVILISGSGPQSRDGEFAGHKLFLVLADYLTRRGIGVLRYDDRGFGQSTGNFSSGTSLDFSYDVQSAIKYLKTRKDVDKTKIGLIGHSDGAMIAPMVAARSRDVSFIVLLAGPGVPGAKLLLDRQELIEKKVGLPDSLIKKSRNHSEQVFKIIINARNTETAKADLMKFSREHYNDIPGYAIPHGVSKDEFIARQIEMFSSPWFKYLLAYDPAPVLQKVTCPVLALNGDKDVQVLAKANLEGIKKALEAGGNTKTTIKELIGMNHAFQECETGMPDEYSKISQTLSTKAMLEMQQWISIQCNR
jgi:hypothetical protein